MFSKRLRGVVLGVVALFLFWRITLPPDDIVIDRTCNVQGWRAQISKTLYGDMFWQEQLTQIKTLREALARSIATKDVISSGANDVSAIERRMSTLSSVGGGVSDQSRDAQRNQGRVVEAIGWLDHCYEILREKHPSH